VCFFTFDKLCNANVGAADYIALTNKFHTIALSGVPIFTADIRNQAYRSAPFHANLPSGTVMLSKVCKPCWASTCMVEHVNFTFDIMQESSEQQLYCSQRSDLMFAFPFSLLVSWVASDASMRDAGL